MIYELLSLILVILAIIYKILAILKTALSQFLSLHHLIITSFWLLNLSKLSLQNKFKVNVI